ncbi:MAG: glycerophosphodiester phosphodiesterase [Betaproteobacteria bacterium]
MSHFRVWPWPRVLAHRGAGILAPENTLAALRIGFEHGFRAVEFDAMAPRDDDPVLIHDDTLDRTAGIHGDVTSRTADQLAQLDAGRWHSPAFAGEPVPRLSEALAYCRACSIWPNVEIKPAPGHEARTGELVARAVARAYAEVVTPGGDDPARLDARVPLLSSFAVDSIVAARRAAPDLPRALLIDAIPEDWRTLLERSAAASLNTNHMALTQERAREIKQAGYWLFCYTVNEPDRARELLSWGVDAFCTDRIDLIGPDFAG